MDADVPGSPLIGHSTKMRLPVDYTQPPNPSLDGFLNLAPLVEGGPRQFDEAIKLDRDQ